MDSYPDSIRLETEFAAFVSQQVHQFDNRSYEQQMSYLAFSSHTNKRDLSPF